METIRKPPSGLILLKKIAEGTSRYTGQKFFDVLVQQLAELLEVSGVWVTEYLSDSNRLRALSFYLRGNFVEEYEYQVEGTPCEPVLNCNTICHFPSKVIELFPLDPDLKPLGAVSYMGLAMRDFNGEILGHLAVLDDKPMAELPEYYSILEIFTGRAAAELARYKVEILLQESRSNLERLVNGIADPVLEFDQHLKLVQYNKAAKLQFSLDQYLTEGKPVSQLLDEEGKVQLTLSLKSILSSGSKVSVTLENFKMVAADGIMFPAAGWLSGYTYRNQLYFTLLVRNLSEKFQSEESIRQLNLQNLLLQEKLGKYQSKEIIGESKKVIAALEMVEQVASTDTNVLITGETGTGKELFARAVHLASRRRDKPMVALNCAALPRELIESELFGHEKAMNSREGRFAMADQGTLLLDEIGELPLDLQAKLLRVLQLGEYEPLGSSQTRKVNVRVIAATNRDLLQEVQNGRFREDLYYRLNVFPIHVPVLREREQDVLLLAQAFLEKFSREQGKVVQPLSEADRQRLLGYHWPGNVRELQNMMERAVILCRQGQVDLSGIIPTSFSTEPIHNNSDQILTEAELRQLEIRNLRLAMEKTGWRISGIGGAASLLGIPHTTLASRLKKLDIYRYEKPRPA